MPLTQEQEDDPYELRMEQMNANIAQMRANKAEPRSGAAYGNRESLVQVVTGAAALLGTRAASGNCFAPKVPAPAPQIHVYLPPYPVPPAAKPSP